MKIKNLYVKNMHHYCFKGEGKISKVIGLVIGTPEGLEDRIAVKVQYPDKDIDFIALSDIGGQAHIFCNSKGDKI